MFLLLITAYTVKKKIYPLRLIYGTFTGTISILLILIRLSNISLFILKFVTAIVMLKLTFKAKGKEFLKITVTFYLLSFTFSGIIYFLKNSFYENNILNYITISLSALIFVILIVLSINSIKKRIYEKNLYKNVTIIHHNKSITLTGFIDSGNNLTEPLTGLPVIIVHKNELRIFGKILTFPIMCHTISGNGVIEVFQPDKFIIDNLEEKVYIGISDKIKNDNFSVLLNNNLRGYKNAS